MTWLVVCHALLSKEKPTMFRAFLILMMLSAVAAAQQTQKTVVLVHGAFADASGWSRVIPILERDGYFVTAVQIPLTSLSDDIATAKRVVDAQKGPVVLVGHSYGGAVITGAAAGNPNVKALVYLAAFAPEAGEPLGEPGKKFAQPPLNSALIPDAAGSLYIDRAKFHDAFCKDLPEAEASVMAATQKPLASSVFEASVSAAAWKTIPSWYVVSSQDRAINPELERFYAKRMGATTSEIAASHVAFLSHSKEVAKIIEDAAAGSVARTPQRISR
jgi:pimeloyl-ACP methyl ester carboxylesterase